MKTLTLFTLLTVAVAVVVGTAQPGITEPVRVLPPDAIPAIDHPQFESVSEADPHFADNELVIGVVGTREQRAYSTWQLDRHEIVNDTFEGRPIAVTW